MIYYISQIEKVYSFFSGTYFNQRLNPENNVLSGLMPFIYGQFIYQNDRGGLNYAKKSRFLKPAVRKRENALAFVSQIISASFFSFAIMRGTA